MKVMREKLESLGLTDKEASVYVSLLKGGEMTAEQLAKLSSLNRSTAYVQIKALMEIGLVSTFKRGKKTYFAAESPNNLERLIDKKSQEIEHQRSEAKMLVPELLKIFGSKVERPAVRIFEGKEGLASMRNAILEQKPDRMLMITAYNQMQKVFTTEELGQFTKKRESLGIESWIIYTLNEGPDFVPYKLQRLKRVYPEQFPFGSDIYIHNDTVSFASATDTIVGLTITNRDVANSMRAMFMVLWNSK